MRALTDRDPHTAWEVAKVVRLGFKYAAAEKAGDTRAMARFDKEADRIGEQAHARAEKEEAARKAEAERNSREAKKARRDAERKEKQKKEKELREARQHKARLDRARGTKK